MADGSACCLSRCAENCTGDAMNKIKTGKCSVDGPGSLSTLIRFCLNLFLTVFGNPFTHLDGENGGAFLFI